MDQDEVQLQIAKKACRTTIFNYILLIFIKLIQVSLNIFGIGYTVEQKKHLPIIIGIKLVSIFILINIMLKLSRYINDTQKIKLSSVEKNQNIFLITIQVEICIMQMFFQNFCNEELLAELSISILSYFLTTSIKLSIFSIIQRSIIFSFNLLLIEKRSLSTAEIIFVFFSAYGFLQQNQIMFNSNLYPSSQYEHLATCQKRILNSINELTYMSKANFIQESVEDGIILSLTIHQISPMLQHISQIFLYFEYLINDLGGSILQLNIRQMDVIFKTINQPASQQQNLAKIINLSDLIIQIGQIYNLQIGIGITYGNITKHSVKVSVNNQLLIQGKSLDIARNISRQLYDDIGCDLKTFKRPNVNPRTVDKYYIHEINKLIFEQFYTPNFYFQSIKGLDFDIIEIERPVNLKKASYDYTQKDHIFSLLSEGDYSESVYDSQQITEPIDRLERSLNDSYSGDLTSLQQSCNAFELQLMHTLSQQLTSNIQQLQQHNCSFEANTESNKMSPTININDPQCILNTSMQENDQLTNDTNLETPVWNENNRNILEHYKYIFKQFRIKNMEYAKVIQINEQLQYSDSDNIFLAMQGFNIIYMAIIMIQKNYILIQKYFATYNYNGIIFSVVLNQHEIWSYIVFNSWIIITIQFILIAVIIYNHMYVKRWFSANYSSIKVRQFNSFSNNIALIQLVLNLYYILVQLAVYVCHSTMQNNSLEIYQQNGNFIQMLILFIIIQLNSMRQPMIHSKIWLGRSCIIVFALSVAFGIYIAMENIYVGVIFIISMILQFDDTLTIHYIQLCNLIKIQKIRDYISEQFEEFHKAYTKLTLAGFALQHFQHFPQLQKMFLKGIDVKYTPLKQLKLTNININDHIYLQLVTQTIEASPIYIPVIYLKNVVLIEIRYDHDNCFDIQQFQLFLDQISKVKNKEIIYQNNIVHINNHHIVLLAYTYQSQRQENLYKLMINCLNFCFRLQKETTYKFAARLAVGDVHGATMCKRMIQFALVGPAFNDLIATPEPDECNRKVYASTNYYNKLKTLQHILTIELQLRKNKQIKKQYNFKINVEFEYYGQLVCFVNNE